MRDDVDNRVSAVIHADKAEQHVHCWPREATWLGFQLGFGLTCGVGTAIAIGSILRLFVEWAL